MPPAKLLKTARRGHPVLPLEKGVTTVTFSRKTLWIGGALLAAAVLVVYSGGGGGGGAGY